MKYQVGLISFLLACQGENVIEKQSNSAPVVMIGSHSPSAEILEGYVETFRATVSDDDNEFDELTVAWYVGDEIVCDWETVNPAGESFCDIVFNEDDNNVIVEVRDPQGAGGRSEIAVVIVPTSAPTVEILTPTQNSNHYSDQLIQFSGMVGDNEDNPEDLIVTWTSNLDGELILDTTPDSAGMISDYGYLSEGQHALELKVEDSSGKVTKEQLVLQVGGANLTPSCEITAPTDSTAVILGVSTVFRGVASDENVEATELSVTWYSDKDGSLGTSQPSSSGAFSLSRNNLSANDHVISIEVEDEVGAICRDEIILFVGTPPSVSIEEPLSGSVFSVGEDILFHGVVADPETPLNQLSVEWESSSAGVIRTGSPDSQGVHQFTKNDLPAGMHTITFEGTDATGLSGTDTVTFRVNTPPTAPTVTLSPDPVYGTGTLTAVATGSVDADGHPISYSYQWYENGTLTNLSTALVASADLDVGDVWTVRAIPNDGYVDGTYTEASIVVSNSLPTVNTPVISTNGSGVYNDSVLTCTATASDADETVTPTFSWDVNGAIVSGSTVDLSNYSVSAGDSVSCIVNVLDSNGGSASATTVDTIDNRPPSTPVVSLSPVNPTTQDQLTCSVVSSDPDGESLTESIEWFVAGAAVSTGSVLDLSTVSTVSPSDTVECVVTVTDGSGATSQSSDSTSVQNTSPTIEVLTLSPTEPTLNDTLSCYAEASDVDGDTPTLSFSFTNQTTGSNFAATTTSTNVATLDISSTDADYDHVLTCSVTATDADGGSDTDAISVTVYNTSPVFDQGAVITPAVVEIGIEAQCSATASDPDDGVASLSYIWQVNGQQVSTGPTWTVNSTDASVGDTLSCTAIAVDFEGNSTTSSSVGSTISNTAPEVMGVVLNNLSPYTNDTLTVASSTYDLNGDTVSLSYEWHVIDGVTGQNAIVQTGVGSAFSSFDGSQSVAFDRDDEVYVRVTPNDGTDSGVTVESDHAMVLNTPPTAPSVVVTSTSNPPIEGEDELTCTVVGPSTDLDGDAFTYTYTWYDPTGTNVQVDPPTSSLFSTFPAADTTAGLWECDVIVSDGTDTNNGFNTIQVDSDWAGTLEFTTCGQTGQTGPSQALCDADYSGTTLDTEVVVANGIQTYMIPADGDYRIEVAGAAGGNSSGYGGGGRGASMIGTFTFSAGDTLSILVGQMGRGGSGGGGGGGTFVVGSGNTPLIIAGGGGGRTNTSVSNGTSNTCGQRGDGSSPGNGGCSGNGGNGASSIGNSGGGGMYTNGTAGTYNSTPGIAFVNGGNGGNGSSGNSNGWGGFGGGAGGNDGGHSGGGGGYSGGGGSGFGGSGSGGGGGSYNAGTNQSNQSGVNTGHGYVIIDKL